MIQKFLAVAIVVLVQADHSAACSAVHYQNAQGQSYVAKSFDWKYDHGMVVVNPRGLKKRAFVPQTESGATWTSKYGSVSFNQLAPEFPFGGINEKGLVVEILWEYGAKSEKAEKQSATNESQYLQRLLDLAATTEEAVALAKEIQLISLVAPVHYFVCDTNSICAVLDYTKGVLNIHSDLDLTLPFHAITNLPYATSLKKVQKFKGMGGKKSVPSSPIFNRSAPRMARVWLASQEGKAGNEISRGFAALKTVKNWLPRTAWNIVYDQSALGVHYLENGVPVSLDISQLDFTCAGKVVRQGVLLGANAKGILPLSESDISTFVDQSGYMPKEFRSVLKSTYQTFACE